MKYYTESSLRQFYTELYHNLRETDTKVIEIWWEISKIPFLIQFNYNELRDFIGNFNFISLKKGNYQDYVVIDKILFILDSINLLELDIDKSLRY